MKLIERELLWRGLCGSTSLQIRLHSIEIASSCWGVRSSSRLCSLKVCDDGGEDDEDDNDLDLDDDIDDDDDKHDCHHVETTVT